MRYVIGSIRGYNCLITTTILYKEKVCRIVGVCMEVYNTLGYGFLEIVYKDAIEIELNEKDIHYEREKEFHIKYKGKILKRSCNADFSLFNKMQK